MLEKFIKSYSGSYNYTAMVRHKGMVIAFAMDANRHIWYSILDFGGNNPPDATTQSPKSFLDVDAWQAAPTELIFPNEIAEVGFGVADQALLPVFKKNSLEPEVAGAILPPRKENEFDYFRSTTARFTADVPFQVLSDGRYIYIFRQAIGSNASDDMVYIDEDGNVLVNKGDEKGYLKFNKTTSKNEWVASSDNNPAPLVNETLLVDRFLLTGSRLTPKMEVRYQRSRSKTRPASRKDSLGAKDLDGNFFYEPTQELRFISNLTGGRFSVLLLPTAIAEIQRWQIFAENNITHNMDIYNVERSADGLFNTRGSQTYTCIDHPQIYDRRIGVCSECGKTLIPRIVTKGYSESALKFNGYDQYINNFKNNFASLFSVDLTPVDELDKGIVPESLRQEFLQNKRPLLESASVEVDLPDTKWTIVDGIRMYQIIKENQSAKTLNVYNFKNAITVETWIKPDNSTQQACIIAKDDIDGAHDYSLGINAGGKLSFAVTVEGKLAEVTSSFVMEAGTWYHIAGTFDGSAVRIFVNGNKEKGETKASGKLSTSAKNLSFAQSSSDTPSPFAGTIDEVRMWERARSESELQADMHQRLTGLETDLVGYWRFDEGGGNDVHDQTSQQLDGVIIGAPRVNFNGSDDYIDLGKGVTVGAAFTQEAWIFPTAMDDEYHGFLGNQLGDNPATRSPSLWTLGRKIHAGFGDGTNWNYLHTKGEVLTLNTWNHVAVTFDGNEYQVYVNGEKKEYTMNHSFAGKTPTNTPIKYIGRVEERVDRFFKGAIEEVRIWERARAQQKIQADMNRRLNSNEIATDLVGYWRLDEGSGNDVHDQSKNRVNGIITGASWVATPPSWVGTPNAWVASDAPVGEHPGIERTSFRIEGRTFTSPPTSLLYYQQSKASGGYSGEEKYIKNAGRVMLAVATAATTNAGNSENSDKNHIAALDFGISLSGRLAQIRDITKLDLLNPEEVVTNESINDTLDRIAEGTAAGNEIQTLKSKLMDGLSVTMPRVQTDPLGLTISGGVLSFAWTTDAPLLFDSATGTLALYFRGKEGQFFVAYYDTFTERARITLLSDGEGTVTCFATSTAYDKVTIQIEVEGDGAFCTVKIKYSDAEGNAIINEIWKKVPRDPIEFSKVLNGQATGHSYIGSGNAKDGELTLPESDPGARHAIKVGTTLMVGNERIEVIEKVFSGGKLIRYKGTVESTDVLPVFYVEYDYAVNASCEEVSADLSNGSILIRAVPAGIDGDMSTTPNEGVDLETPLVCKWTAAAPGSTISFDGRTQYAQGQDSNNLKGFDAASDLTLEAWVKPGLAQGQISVIQQKSTDSTYMLGLDNRTALEFDGENDYVEIPKADQYNFGPDQNFTVETWIKILPQQGNSLGIIEKWSGSGGYPFVIRYMSTTGKITAYRYDSDTKNTPAIVSSTPLNDGIFHHVGFVKDGNTLRLFIDGKQEGDDTPDTTTTNTSNDSPLYFGRRGGGTPRYFAGAIDEVRVWSRARTREEILGDMNHRLSGSEVDLVGYWHFGDGQARDYSRYHNNGTISKQSELGVSPITEYKVCVGVGEKLVQTQEIIPANYWSHLAAVYKRASSLKFGLGDGGHLDCGNSDTLNINGDLTIEISFQLDDLSRDYGVLTRGKLNSPGQNVPYSLAVNKDGYIELSFEDVNDKEHIFTSSKTIKDEVGIGKLHYLSVTRKRKSHIYSEPYHRNVDGTMIESYRSVTFIWDEIHIYIKSNLPNANLSDTMERYVYNDDNDVENSIMNVLQGKRPDPKYFPPEGLDTIQWKPDDIGRSNLPLEIGRSSAGSFKGTVMDVRIWNVARESSQFDKTITGEESELVSWWRFQERSGIKTNDSKGQNHAAFKGLIDWVPNPDPQKSSLNLYINGQPVEMVPVSTKDADTWEGTVNQFALGARKLEASFDQYFRGELEDVRIWETARTEEQIQDNLFRRIQGEKEDLIAYYTFDAETENQVSDYSLRGNHLELKGSALVFDGVNDHVKIPNADQINFGKDQNFTVEAWIKASPTQADIRKGDNDIIEKWSSSGGPYPFVIRLNRMKGKFTAGRYDGTQASGLESTQKLNDGEFHHVAFVKDGKTLRLYIDGKKDNEAHDTTENDTTNDSPLYLGCRGVNRNRFKGVIDEVRIWNTARDEQDIQKDMYRRLSGKEINLVGYWHFYNNEAQDYSISKNNGTIVGNPALSGGPTHVLSTAPVGDDTPQVRSALAGIRTPFSGKIGSAPAIQEYGDMQLDSQGNLIGVFKRCYSFIQEGKWQIVTGYKVGDMVTEWIGQVQFAPQLIGFIEGAPPVPGENLTMQSVQQIGDEDDYNEASVIELTEAEETTDTYAASRNRGFDMLVESNIGVGPSVKVYAGLGVLTEAFEIGSSGGIKSSFEHSLGWLDDASTSVDRTIGKSIRLELRGRFSSNDAGSPSDGRFIPDNTGLALVRSETADVYALRLRHNGALIAYQMRPNLDIPKDWNIIHFPINPRYTKQGTLDGKVGLEVDVDYPNAITYSPDSSYFKPIEAYTLKNRINRDETQLRTLFEQYAAGEIGRRQEATHFSEKDLADAAGRMLEKLPNIHKRNLINTYVWTADGGLFAETQETMDTREEMIGGSHAFIGMAGLYIDFSAATSAAGVEFAANALFGGHLNLTVTKTKESRSSYQMEINLDKVERDIYARTDGSIDLDTSDPKRPKPIKQPGKVDAYRFMSFHLEPHFDHFDDFFNLVVDPIWLEQSDDPSAVALRSARDDNKDQRPAPWRIMHRVTYISRVLPPLDLSAPPSLEKTLQTLDIDSNYELIKQLDPYVRDHLTDFSEFTQAVDNALEAHLPELKSHHKEIKQFLGLYYGIDEYMLAPQVEGIDEGQEIELAPNRPPTVKIGQYPEALELTEKEIPWKPDSKISVSDDRLKETKDLFLTWKFIPSEGQSLNDVKFGEYQTVEEQEEEEFVENSHEKLVTARFTKKGRYRLRLTASDGILSASDETVLVVNEAPVIESLTAEEPKPIEGSDTDFTVKLKCTIRTGLGDSSSYDKDLKLAWSVVSGSKEHVAGLETDETLVQDEHDPNKVTASKTITIKNRGFYLLKCTVNIGSFSHDSEINLEIAARVTDGLQALYTFEAKDGTSVYDVSGSDTPLNLVVSDPTSIGWLDGGLALRSPGILSGAAKRLTAAIRSSNALTIEAWIKPTELDTPGLRRILTLSNGPAARNFILAQSGNTYHVGLRTSDDAVSDLNASLKSLVGGVTDVDRLAHIVFTRDAEGNAQLYVNLEPKLEGDTQVADAELVSEEDTQVVDGEPVSKKDTKLSGAEPVSDRIVNGDFSKWDENFQLALGNEFDSEGRSDRAWLGEYHLLAIYDRALSEEEIKQNFDFGADRNLPPQVSAGKDIEINWSIPAIKDGEKWLTDDVSIDDNGRLTLDLHGVVRHDRPTTGSIEWSHVSDHPSVDFDDASDPGTKARFPSSGDYKLRLTATDDIDQVVSKEIMISITHETPVVKIDITDKNLIVTPDHVNTVTLDGAQADLALGGTIENSLGGAYQQDKLTFTWVCEPKNNFIEGTNQLNAKAIFDKNGIYKLTLTATNKDNEEIAASESVYITVNRPPVVDAGPDQTLLLFVGDPSITTQLDGTVSDDGLPEPPGVLKLNWSVLSGDENDVTIMSDEKDFTEVQFKSEGDYTLKLEAGDGAVKVSDTVKITVKNTGMLPDGGRQAKVLANHLNVRQDHDPDNAHNILYTLNMGNEVTVIDLWTNPETNAVWGRLKSTEKHDQDPQWSAMKVGKDTFLEFME